MRLVEVFKTSVKTEAQVAYLRPDLCFLLKGTNWNFDLDDCDNILRIETVNPKVILSVKRLLQKNGFECVVLPD